MSNLLKLIEISLKICKIAQYRKYIFKLSNNSEKCELKCLATIITEENTAQCIPCNS